ncbi:MAG TPA: thioredoxin family protein [Plasticicumulans sp.]|uniref:thioredoxin family protein n=1 Tax=Plasticicumulans sp. TaxID=2307179 RepID=UPI002C85AF01|nr:thioredoxin family protein [Plasticicumulans sp.]HMW31676.1 thioredoxin family protein [Plasticicumulans sp.]HMZ11080.1 thioredoxin family protein [Plasticicumulans sp.]HNB91202.1 thioredoxin family protein [Plasticicumulans sp.]HNE01073.1 thioredoxin family protein [Plasticicumulans sp.]HNK32211.1 thioredoxin family protein [Plasticicumulans sp.]
MVLLHTPVCDFGLPAPDFDLPGVDGRRWTRDAVRGPAGLLVMFICNHCPYVQAVRERLVREARDLAALGIGVVAISANDPADYPEDDFAHMQAVAREFGYPFPYLFDESQQVARAYGAVCTPDFFGYNRALELQYRGRLDASGRQPAPAGAVRELYEAMKQVAGTGRGPAAQLPGMGCSIKWKAQGN